MTENLHVAILGAGPTGLEAALATAEHGYDFTLFEAGDGVAGHVDGWRHVRLFTPWSMNVSGRMRDALGGIGRTPPDDDSCPTGGDLIEQLYEPLLSTPALEGHVELGTRVLSVGRQGLLKHEEIASAERGSRPFRLLVESADGEERLVYADIILDCTGSSSPNTLGGAGIPAPGERKLGDRIIRDVPNFETDAAEWAGQTTLLVGAGHSAQTALHGFAELIGESPGTRVVWAVRHGAPKPVDGDPLPGRYRLTSFAADVAARPPAGVEVRTQTTVDGLSLTDDGQIAVRLRSGHDAGTDTVKVDRILSLTGRIGDHQLYRQLQIHECYATSGPMKLAAALLSASGGGGDCLTQTSHGPDTLRSPEPGFFILGSKSYGRRNDYLMRVGWQQVDEIFQLLD
ncbi:MAG: FAD-dependent oxidoreductase [Acidobacteriota bacterium]